MEGGIAVSSIEIGEVYIGTMKDRHVAVKKLKDFSSNQGSDLQPQDFRHTAVKSYLSENLSSFN